MLNFYKPREGEMELQHSCHPHPLTLIKENNNDGKEVVCYVCYQKILGGSSAYSCKTCSFFLHKLCAELPAKITHPIHPKHPLILLPQNLADTVKFHCNVCEDASEAFTYRCFVCDFDLDVFCALKAQLIEPQSHKNPLYQEAMSNKSPNDRFSRIITNWEKGQLLGRGSFGSVYEGIADGGFLIAVKEVSLLDQGDQGRQSISQLEQEIALLSQFKHENIVQYYGTSKDESNLCIFLELVTKGSLLNLYQNYNLQDSIVSLYTRQILHGLKYLHEQNVVHRDIKCANILVHANGSVKLADFGLAKVTKLNDVKSFKGTPFWMAPEVVKRNDQGYGLPADIWSLGCTVLEMLTRQIPYADLESMQALFRIGMGVPPPVPDSLSMDARDFILKCLQVNPNARPTAAELLDHSFIKRPLPSSSGSSSPYKFG